MGCDPIHKELTQRTSALAGGIWYRRDYIALSPNTAARGRDNAVIGKSNQSAPNVHAMPISNTKRPILQRSKRAKNLRTPYMMPVRIGWFLAGGSRCGRRSDDETLVWCRRASWPLAAFLVGRTLTFCRRVPLWRTDSSQIQAKDAFQLADGLWKCKGTVRARYD
jgi:hypothetical protein